MEIKIYIVTYKYNADGQINNTKWSEAILDQAPWTDYSMYLFHMQQAMAPVYFHKSFHNYETKTSQCSRTAH